MYLGPRTKNTDNVVENEELQIVEAMYQSEEFPDSYLDDDNILFEPQD